MDNRLKPEAFLDVNRSNYDAYFVRSINRISFKCEDLYRFMEDYVQLRLSAFSQNDFYSLIDNRVIKSTTEGSLTGLNFDTSIEDGKEVTIMLLTDRYGREHPMRLDKDSANEIIEILKKVK